MQRIGVFLSANAGLPEIFRQAAQELGEWIGRTGRTLIYGGSNRGLMDVIGHAVKDNGGRTIGVVPQILFDKGWNAQILDKVIRTEDLVERKVQLIKQSDILVALPGGIGTLDELFTAVGIAAIGFDAKTVVLYNVDGCWNHLIAMVRIETSSLYRPHRKSPIS